MPESPLPLLRKNLRVNQKALLDILTRSRRRIESYLASVAGGKQFGANGNVRRAAISGVVKRYQTMIRELDEWSKDVVKGTSKSFFDKAKDEVPTGGKLKVTKFNRKYAEKYFQMVHPGNAPSLAAVQTQKMLQNDIQQLRNVVIDAFREGSVSGWSAVERQRAIRDRMTKLVSDGLPSWQFVSRDGKKWNRGNYFNMLNRTITARVGREAYTDSLIEAGFDLATVQGGGDPCPVCSAWQGVIVSISGANKDYPSRGDAEAAGVFHPNCVCELVYIDETARKKEIQRQADEPNPKKPGPEEWTEYARNLRRGKKEMVAVAKTPKALKNK